MYLKYLQMQREILLGGGQNLSNETTSLKLITIKFDCISFDLIITMIMIAFRNRGVITEALGSGSITSKY